MVAHILVGIEGSQLKNRPIQELATMSRLLLISSSRFHGHGFLEHCRDAMADHLHGIDRILFIPWALADHDRYEQTVRPAFEAIGVQLESIHHAPHPADAIDQAAAIFVGGGNTFRLLKHLYDQHLLQPIRDAVRKRSVPYMGSSAGTNIAAPTIRTTNDMPIVEPPSFTALGLVPFQINPHYLDADPNSTHQGETRMQRLLEYLEENRTPVVALREGCWLVIRNPTCTLEGHQSAMLFQRDQPPENLSPPADLSDWMEPSHKPGEENG